MTPETAAPATTTPETLTLPARPARVDIYDRVTQQIIALLEEGGPLPWVKPWHAEHLAGRISRPLRSTGEPYQGINVLVLWLTAEAKGYSFPCWLTYKQCQEHGGQVRKGEKGTPVVYAGKLTKEQEKADGSKEDKQIFFMREYTVFNAEQADGLPERFTKMAPVPGQAAPVVPIDACERYFEALGAELRHGGNQAFYSVTQDYIQLPARQTFRDALGYYGTLAHETVHWTSPPTRANRVIESRRFGSESYAFEELVAELGAAFLCADLGIAPVTPRENAAYLAHWLKVLKANKRAIFTAAAMAQKAVDWCHGKQPGSDIGGEQSV